MVVPVSAGRVDTAVVAASVIHGALVLILASSLVLRHQAVTGSTPYGTYLYHLLVREQYTVISSFSQGAVHIYFIF